MFYVVPLNTQITFTAPSDLFQRYFKFNPCSQVKECEKLIKYMNLFRSVEKNQET